jgi:hypothetical protein
VNSHKFHLIFLSEKDCPNMGGVDLGYLFIIIIIISEIALIKENIIQKEGVGHLGNGRNILPDL